MKIEACMRRTVSAALFASLLLFAQGLFAQRYPERGLTRNGNRDYEKQNYESAEVDYRRALEKNPAFYEAVFNLGDAVYRQQRFEESAKLFSRAAMDSTASVDDMARSFYNKGNAEFAQQKYSEALESYKQSLRLNPDDLEAKYNLAYTKKMLEQQQNQQNGGNGNDNQNQDNDKNRNNDRNQDNGGDDKQDSAGNDSENDRNDEHDDSSGDDNGEQGQKPQPQQGHGEPRISQQEAEQMLQAVQQQEDKTRDKVNEKKGVAVGRSGKNW